MNLWLFKLKYITEVHVLIEFNLIYINAYFNLETFLLAWDQEQLTEIILKKNNFISLDAEIMATSWVWSDAY